MSSISIKEKLRMINFHEHFSKGQVMLKPDKNVKKSHMFLIIPITMFNNNQKN
jgi:hypothetical protein